MKISRMRIDGTLSRDGVWITIMGDCEFLVSQWQNPEHKEVIADLTRRDIDVTTLEGRAALVAPLIKDWRGLELDDGQPDTHSVERAIELLSDPELEWIMDKVQISSMDLDTYRAATLKDTAKNS